MGVTPISWPMAMEPIDVDPHLLSAQQAASLAGQFSAGAAAKTEVVNVFVEIVRPHLEGELDGGDIA